MQIKIIFKKGERAGEDCSFAPPGIFIGSASDNDICLTSEKVSQYHSEILFKNSNWYLKNKADHNNTKINGNIISTDTALHSGDLIHIGTEAFQVEFEIPDDAIPVKIRAPREKKRNIEIVEEDEFCDIPDSRPKKRVEKSQQVDAERARRRLANRMMMSEFAIKKKRLSRVIIFIAVVVNIIILMWWLSKQGVDFEYIKKMILK